jgi:hypothetical protein
MTIQGLLSKHYDRFIFIFVFDSADSTITGAVRYTAVDPDPGEETFHRSVDGNLPVECSPGCVHQCRQAVAGTIGAAVRALPYHPLLELECDPTGSIQRPGDGD